MLTKIHHFFKRHYHSRYRGFYHHAKQLLIFDIILFGLAFVMLGTSIWFFLWKPGLTDLVELTISLGDQRIKSGDTAHLTISYANHSKFNLHDSVLGLRLPPGLILYQSLTSTTTVLLKDNSLSLSTLAPGSQGHIDLYGTFWTEPQTEEKIIAILSYLPENNNIREQKFGAFFASLPDSVLEGTLIVPTSSFPNRSIPFTYILSNTSAQAIEAITLGNNWLNPQSGQNNENIFSLKPNETKTITGQIGIPPQATDFIFKIFPQVLINTQRITQIPSEKKVAIFSPNISAQAKLLTKAPYAETNQSLPIELSWNNMSAYQLTHLRLRLQTTPGVVDIARTARENRLKNDKGVLLIDASTRTALASGKRGTSDTFTIDLALLPSFTLGNTENASLEITPIVEGRVPEVAEQIFREPGMSAQIPLATELTLKTETRYYTSEGDQLGRGPLPPRVGATTKYWIFIQALNTTNALREAVFSATLFPAVEFTGKQSVTIGPPIKYNPYDKTVSWNFRDLPPHSQTGLYFEVAVNPTPVHSGQTIPLIKNIFFSATDSVVGKTFSLSKAELTNILNTDDRGARLGAAVITR